MIKFDNVNKVYSNGLHALKNVSLEIKQGEFVAIIGLSGAGKSTLVRLINQLEVQDSGKIFIDGQDLGNLSQIELRKLRTKVGMIFQHFNLLWSRTVSENIELALEIAGNKDKRIRQQKVQELVELVGLTGRENAYPSELSGGQKQRVAIAGVVALRPAILILDEATSMLDPEGRRELIETVKGIRKDYDMTVISITHDLEEVAMSDRVLVMKRGEIESTSSPRELFSRNDLDQTILLPIN